MYEKKVEKLSTIVVKSKCHEKASKSSKTYFFREKHFFCQKNRKQVRKYLRVPLQRLFHLPGGEFKGIFLADWSEQCRAVLNLILLDWFGLHEPFYGPGQCF